MRYLIRERSEDEQSLLEDVILQGPCDGVCVFGFCVNDSLERIFIAFIVLSVVERVIGLQTLSLSLGLL